MPKRDDREEVDQNDPRIIHHGPTAERIFDRLAAMVVDAEEAVERHKAGGTLGMTNAVVRLDCARHAFAVATGTAAGGMQFGDALAKAKARLKGEAV